MSVSTAMVMAAGLGTRMRPLTDVMPKPLIPVSGIPLIDRALDWLASSGVQDVVVNTHYLPDMLEKHLAGRTLPHIRISREEVLLETGGGLLKALPLLGERFFSLNSDTICIDNPDSSALGRLQESWKDDAMDALLLLHPREKAIGYEGAGDFFLEKDGTIRRRSVQETAPYVFTGVQLLHRRLFEAAPQQAFSLNVLYDRNRSADGVLPRIHAIVHTGNWLHVGDPHGLKLAEAWFEQA